jgi:hypothetical protein
MYTGLHVEYPLFLLDFNETLIFSTYFRKMLRYKITRKSVWWEPSCSMQDRHDKANSHFSQFLERAQKRYYYM